MARIPSFNEQVIAINVSMKEDQLQDKIEEQLWKCRRVKKGCYTAAAIETILTIVILVPGLIFRNDPAIYTATGMGLLAFTTVITTLNCCTPNDSDAADYHVG